MSNVTLQNIQLAKESELFRGTYILLLHANKIPPHIGLVVDGKYYSLTANETQSGVDVKVVWRTIQLKKIGSLFIMVDSIGSSSLLNEVFDQYDRAIAGKVSCLQPIKQYFHQQHQIKIDDVSFIFDLVERLEEYDLLTDTFHANLEKELTSNSFTLIKYTLDEIYSRIQQLQKETVDA